MQLIIIVIIILFFLFFYKKIKEGLSSTPGAPGGSCAPTCAADEKRDGTKTGKDACYKSYTNDYSEWDQTIKINSPHGKMKITYCHLGSAKKKKESLK